MYIVYDDDMFISMLSFIHTWIDRKIDGLIDNDVWMYGCIDVENNGCINGLIFKLFDHIICRCSYLYEARTNKNNE